MKKFALIGLIVALFINFADAYDRYSNESLIIVPNGKAYNKKRCKDGYCNDILSNSDVILMLDDRYDDGYRRNYKRKDYRREITDQYMRQNGIGRYDGYDPRDSGYNRGYNDGYDDGYNDRDDEYYNNKPRLGIRVR